jgi:anti-sigma-K factor RskA
MLFVKYLLMVAGYGLLGWGVAISLNNLNKVVQYRRQLRTAVPEKPPEEPQLDWTTAKWTLLGAWLPIILATGIAVVPSGMGGVRVSQTSGTRPGTLYPGVHLITPLVDSVQLYDTRDQVLTTSTAKGADSKAEPFTVQSKEGLSIG